MSSGVDGQNSENAAQGAAKRLPEDLMAALYDILGVARANTLVGPSGDQLEDVMIAAAVRCFRHKRPEDEHTAALRRAFAAANRGEL